MNGFELLGTVGEVFSGVLAIEDVEDVVFDCRGDGGWFVAIDCDSLVDLLKRQAVTIEFTVGDEVWITCKDRLDLFVQVSQNFVIPKVLIAGLEP